MSTGRFSARTAMSAGALGLLAIGALIGFWVGARGSNSMSGPQPVDDRQVLYWYDPMVPDQHFDKPGKSPFMDMQLVPRHAGEAEPQAGVRIDPGVVQNLGVRYAMVEKGDVSASMRAVGALSYTERGIAIVQAKRAGFVEHSRQRAVGDIVRAGDPLADIRVPEWTAALAEYLALRGGPDTALAGAARQRLAMLGTPVEAVAEADKTGKPTTVFTIRAPIAGALTAVELRDGMALAAGAPIATINGVSPLWLTVSVPQANAGPLRQGGRAVARFSTYPGATFAGRIDAVLPSANMSSRAVEVRIALPNADGRLRPGLTGEVDLSDAEARQVLVVPSEAVIRTGRRVLVIVSVDGGRFEPVEVGIGAERAGKTEVLSGLAEGQRIVASGQFLIGSEASLTGAMANFERQTSAQRGSADAPYSSTGQITALDASGVTIAHAPVERLSWPSMTMAFAWGKGGAQSLAVGDEVAFSFRKAGNAYVIETIARTGGQR